MCQKVLLPVYSPPPAAQGSGTRGCEPALGRRRLDSGVDGRVFDVFGGENGLQETGEALVEIGLA